MLLVRSNAPTVHVLIDTTMGLILTIVPIAFRVLMYVLPREPGANDRTTFGLAPDERTPQMWA